MFDQHCFLVDENTLIARVWVRCHSHLKVSDVLVYPGRGHAEHHRQSPPARGRHHPRPFDKFEPWVKLHAVYDSNKMPQGQFEQFPTHQSSNILLLGTDLTQITL